MWLGTIYMAGNYYIFIWPVIIYICRKKNFFEIVKYNTKKEFLPIEKLKKKKKKQQNNNKKQNKNPPL